ncbi:MAG: TIGR01440 family protein [Clostridia bacterium]
MDYDSIFFEARRAINELLAVSSLKRGDIVVIGCSTSEVMGKMIGSGSSELAACAIMDAVLPRIIENELRLAVQCCEHLNRALIVERETAEKYDFPEVNVVPMPHAGGAFAVKARETFKDWCAVENINSRASAGIDIGGTLIGMHLKPVVVPIHTDNRNIGEARVVLARTRRKFVGGERAVYDDKDKR